jgi:micrococcal nuclease
MAAPSRTVPRVRRMLLAIVLLASMAAAVGSEGVGRSGGAGGAQGDPGSATRSLERVVRVVDGDTVVLSRSGRSRLIGVDTPEVFGRHECFGRQASAFTRRRLQGRRVRVRLGVEPRDRYGRALVYLWHGERLFNADLVRLGYATPMTIPPNVQYADRFVRLAREARRANRGLWGAGC